MRRIFGRGQMTFAVNGGWSVHDCTNSGGCGRGFNATSTHSIDFTARTLSGFSGTACFFVLPTPSKAVFWRAQRTDVRHGFKLGLKPRAESCVFGRAKSQCSKNTESNAASSLILLVLTQCHSNDTVFIGHLSTMQLAWRLLLICWVEARVLVNLRSFTRLPGGA